MRGFARLQGNAPDPGLVDAINGKRSPNAYFTIAYRLDVTFALFGVGDDNTI